MLAERKNARLSNFDPWGYGLAGKLLTKHLLAESDAKIILGGRNLDKADEFARQLGDSRISTIRVDATDANSLRSALQNVDFLLNAAPTSHYTETVVRVALDAGVDYLDLQYSREKIATLQRLEPEIKKSGLCFITEAGCHPGLPSVMVRNAATRMDSLESAIGSAYMNMGKDLPYSEAVDELMEEFIDYQAQVFKKGVWTKPGSWDMRKIDFGKEIGRRMCYSIFLEEMRALPEMYPSLKETGFYISGSNWFTDFFLTPVIMLGLKLAPKRCLTPMGKLMWWGMQQSPPPYLVAFQVEATGLKDGRMAHFLSRIEHKDAYEMTAIPVIACLAQYLDGSARRPGLHMMGQLAEPVRLFEDMQRMGIRIVTDDDEQENLEHHSVG